MADDTSAARARRHAEHAAQSQARLLRTLDRYRSHPPPGAPLTPDEATALRAQLTGGAATLPFERALRFAQTIPQLAAADPNLPPCNLGDLLGAQGALPVPDPLTSRPVLTRDAFDKLGFAGTSAGIGETQRTNKEGWWAHAKANKAFILAAAALPEKKQLAVVLGAGQAFDLPLPEIAGAYDRTILVDVDEKALEATIATLPPNLRDKVTPSTTDLSGINSEMVERLDAAAAVGGDAAALEARLCAVAAAYHNGPLPALAPEKADLLVSGMVLTQLPFPQRTYAQALYEKRFGPLERAAEARWNAVWGQFLMRLQQDHIDSLVLDADLVALTTDTVIRPTALDPAGVERPTGAQIRMLGTPTLRDRIPGFLSVERHASWLWHRVRPSKRTPHGSQIDVEAVVLRAR